MVVVVEAAAGAAAAEASVRGRGRQKAYVRLRPLLLTVFGTLCVCVSARLLVPDILYKVTRLFCRSFCAYRAAAGEVVVIRLGPSSTH